MRASDIQILRLLSCGIDVRSGTPVADDHLLRDPLVIEVLGLALNLADAKQRRRKKRNASAHLASIATSDDKPQRHGSKWGAEEVDRLREEFHSARNVDDLAKSHGRSRLAIMSQLERMGLIAPASSDSLEPEGASNHP